MKNREDIEQENNERIAFVNQHGLPVNTVIDYKDEYVCLFHYPYKNDIRNGSIQLKSWVVCNKPREPSPVIGYRRAQQISDPITLNQVIVLVLIVIVLVFVLSFR